MVLIVNEVLSLQTQTIKNNGIKSIQFCLLYSINSLKSELFRLFLVKNGYQERFFGKNKDLTLGIVYLIIIENTPQVRQYIVEIEANDENLYSR